MRRARDEFNRVLSSVSALAAYLEQQRNDARAELLKEAIRRAEAAVGTCSSALSSFLMSALELVNRSLQFAKQNCDAIESRGDALRVQQQDLIQKLENSPSEEMSNFFLSQAKFNKDLLDLNLRTFEVAFVGHDLLAKTLDETVSDSLHFLRKLLNQRPGHFDFVTLFGDLAADFSARQIEDALKFGSYPELAFAALALTPFIAILNKFIELRTLGESADEYLSFMAQLEISARQWAAAALSAGEVYRTALPCGNTIA